MALTQTPYGAFYYFEPDSIGREVASGRFLDCWLHPYMDALGLGKVFVDVGSSIGFYTVYQAQRGIKVHSFEASPEVFDLLRRNVELNGVHANVTLYNEALFDSEQELWLETKLNQFPVVDGKIDYEHTHNSAVLCLVPKDRGTNFSGYRFVTKTLDSFSLAEVGLLKIDTQGADRILHGARDTIMRCRPVILFEHEPELLVYHNDTFAGFLDFYSSVGYKEPVYVGGVDYVAFPDK